uniref:Tudor domain-containing protein 7-like n=1 Tax=Saccoglossus kowalevskii TaxID=10224 RepID=A0ABM0MM17_SACKO|nr:PREDICTED: tudor domain-containing protein 7-like [Saccoglossus kowalevskii]
MDEKKLASLKTTIRAVLQSSKEGVLARLFSRDLYDMTGESVPYAKLGFPDLDSFFRSIHDTVRIGLNRDGEKTYYCVVDESTAHLHKMISAQRSSKKRKGRGRGKISSARRPTYPQPRKSYYTPRSSSRYGPMATPRSKSYSSSSYISMPRINPVKPVPLESTYQPRTSSNAYQPRSNSVTSVYNKPTVKSTVTVVYNKPTVKSTVTAVPSSHSTYEVPPRFQKQRQQTSRSDSSSSYTTVSTDSHSAYLQSSTDILKGIEDYKSLFQEYIDKKFRRQVDVKLFQSATFDWKASVELNGELYCNTERASSKSEAAQLACKVAITALYENIMKYVDIGKYCTTKLDNCQGNSSQHRVPTKPTKRTREDEWFADRIKELVNSKPNGIWGTRFSVEYKTKYKEEPPAGLLEKLQSWTDIVSVEMIMNKIILYPAKTQQCKTEELTSRLSLIDLKANGDSKKLPHVGSAPAKLSDSALVNRVSAATTAYNLDGCGDDNLRITVSQTGAIRSVSGKSGTTNKVCVEKKKIKILPPRVPAIGSSNQVYISHVESCSEFYVHDNDCNINDIMDEIRDHYELTTKPPPILSDYNIGEHCIAQYSGDICWCRAIILGITQKSKTMDEIHVQFIDFGNQETVTQDRVRELIPMCATSPSLAIPCQLYGVQPLKNESNWSKAANKRFTELTKEELIMKIVELTGKCEIVLV